MSDAAHPIRLLVAEDETNLSQILEQFFRSRGFAVSMVRNGRDAIERLRYERYDVVLLDIVMPHMDGLEVLRQLRSRLLPPEVIVVSGNSSVDTALSAMRLGAYDTLAKPYRMAEVEAVVRRAWEKRVLVRNDALLRARLARLLPPPVMETHSAPVRAMLSLAERTADSDAPVLISGEQGAGKETLARQLHASGKRRDEPFVVVSGAELSNATAEGADAIEVAASGTLFVRDVDRLSEQAQLFLLMGLVSSMVDSGRDAAHKVPLEARVIASTTLGEVALGEVLNGDLVRLLGSVRLDVPPLRERAADIPLLARHFLVEAGSPAEPEPPVMSLLTEYAWPGNIAELRLTMERAALLAGGDSVGVRHIVFPPEPPVAPKPASGTFRQLSELERSHIAHALEYTGWHQGRASELLGISPKTLYRKIREYGFTRPKRNSTESRGQS